MNCDLINPTIDGERLRYRCRYCRRELLLRPDQNPVAVKAKCGLKHPPRENPAAPTDGPGTELKEILTALALKEKIGCGCGAMAATMNKIGVAGCRARRDELAAKLRETAKKYTWLESTRAAANALAIGLRIDPLDAYGSLVDEACHRAEAKERGAIAAIELAPIQPHARLRINPAALLPNPHQFNCSILRWGNGWLLAYRLGWINACVAVAKLDNDFQVLGNWRLDLKTKDTQEDPRLFLYRGEPHLSFTVGKVNPAGKFKGSTIAYARLAWSDGWQVANEWEIASPLRAQWEKNWGFFQHGEDLLAVYSIRPHRIVRIEGRRASIIHQTACTFEGKQTLLHGGAPPVFHRGEWFSFYHRIAGKGINRIYTLDLYSFENRPPFRPSRHIPESLLAANHADRPAPTIPHAVFPGGAAIDDQHFWNISFGYYDKWCEVAKWDCNQLERLMKPLAGGPMDGISYRPGTSDLAILKEVREWNEYGLPERFEPEDMIIDIGAHIGSFSLAATDRGARVLCCEPFAESADLLARNLAGKPVEIRRLAVGGERGRVTLWTRDPGNGHVVSTVIGGDEVGSAEQVTLADVLQGRKVRMLKIDCEGAEYEILVTAISDGTLDLVQEIVGEAHTCQWRGRTATVETIAEILSGWAVTWRNNANGTWDFRAIRLA